MPIYTLIPKGCMHMVSDSILEKSHQQDSFILIKDASLDVLERESLVGDLPGGDLEGAILDEQREE